MSNSSTPSIDVKKLSAQYSIQNLSVAIAKDSPRLMVGHVQKQIKNRHLGA